MIVVHVEHFLKPERREYFSDWIKETAAVLRTFEGFISIAELKHLGEENECHLLLKFKNEHLLRQWAESKDHDQLIKKLKPHRRKKQKSTIFQQKEIYYHNDEA